MSEMCVVGNVQCSIYVGTVFCLLAFENAERRLKPYEERPKWEAKPWLQSGRNTKFPFDTAHPTRNMFYNPAVNANPHTGYEDGDNERRLFAAPSGFIHDPKKKAIPEADSLEANIFSMLLCGAFGLGRMIPSK